MRLYARQVSGSAEIRVDVLPFVPENEVIQLDSPANVFDSLLCWLQPPLLVNGQSGDWQFQLPLLSGSLLLLDAHAAYAVYAGREADELRQMLLMQAQHLLYLALAPGDIHHPGLKLLEAVRAQLFRLGDRLSGPREAYQFL